ncbi:uncharacterized protein LOC110858372 [Folsomia candida]|uniref:Protein quiver n=1 Tax=Folsomia candida TaxID=158441 RepID=A0A226DEF7_FOLCA|nr:uncharacterized protein LOC110858372 [Folsomia candida]OXA43549.1 hypothetical protein Fcan01_21596 [Folsomia candida]
MSFSVLRKVVPWSWSTILIILCFYLNQYCEGKRMCYICNTNKLANITLERDSCLDNPENGTSPENIVECKHFCTIKRKEFLSIPGEWIVISLERNCEERPFILDGVEAENHVMTYYRSCRANLCNDGDGLTSLKYILDEPDEEEDDENVTNSSTHFATPSPNYRSTTIRIFKIYFFAFVAFIFSIT